MKKIFIDGSSGTTGLRIRERLSARDDIEIIDIDPEKRKDTSEKKKLLNLCDIAFLCLPDDAAKEAVSLIENPDVIVLDTSTAHRTDENWTYGFPELGKAQFEKVKNSKRIAVPGCHASWFIALVYPLVESGILPKDVLLTCHSLTGYSGGGKKMIGEYENENHEYTKAPRQYGIAQTHKHLKEMKAISGIENFPVFCPIVSNFYSGMQLTVPLFKNQLADGYGISDIKNVYKEKYAGPMVKYTEDIAPDGFINTNCLKMKDSMAIGVFGNEDRMILVAVYDNLGKGASGAAIECMNICIDKNITEGLEI
ncbi:MAG: N-acetyl-gamma-glutamyl-phosphate reductase [Clostridia bacterium]|nr:N-acetyl-gamma-glutamyl-phosphate reductase [Clostridia bacterium]